MVSLSNRLTSWRNQTGLAIQALRAWTTRQIAVAAVAAVIVGLLIGIATVLLPNPVFTRDMAPVWWNYPVWILTSVLSGMLLATYVRAPTSELAAVAPTEDEGPNDSSAEDRRGSRLGMIGGVMAWFAVGCPVCNKIALVALGYSGAITYFAPIQPFLALGAMLLTGVALIWRLKGQVACALPVRKAAVPA
jgi:MFS family permease